MERSEIFKKLSELKSRQMFFDSADEEQFCAIMYDVAVALELDQEQIDALGTLAETDESEITDVESVDEPALPEINPADYEFDSGYIGSLGRTFETATHETFMQTVEAAAEFNETDTNNIVDMLLDGKAVTWQKSPNYYYDHSHGVIRRKQRQQVELVRCACGCEVPRAEVMSASLGTSCPDCYDRMSDAA